MQWEPVIGLEVHVELNTRTKLFSSALNHFGDEPNTNISNVCTGQPGSLPVLNKEAVHKAVLFGCAVEAEIATYSRFDRKSYFYPDSPRNFQITQFAHPIVKGGHLIADVEGVPKKFTIDRAHLEDDAGMLKHFSGFAGVDYNRAGVPLIEIVSTPCIFSIKEAIAYAMGLKAVLQYLDVSDCNMEEGSLRIDANISVRPKGSSELRPKIEIKNINSFNYMGLALESEFKRQVAAYARDPGFKVIESTYRFDPETKKTILMRLKESSDDYRYFLEPDLPPLILEEEYIDGVRQTLPELPYAREKRYLETYGLANETALILVNEKALADFFDAGLETCSNAKSLANWIVVEFAGRYKESGKNLWSSGILPTQVASLVNKIDSGEITGKIAKKVADLMVAAPGKDPSLIIEENPNFKPMDDAAQIEAIIDQVLIENRPSVEDFLAGKEKAFGFLIGQVMKASQGKAPPPLVNQLLKQKLKRA